MSFSLARLWMWKKVNMCVADQAPPDNGRSVFVCMVLNESWVPEILGFFELINFLKTIS